MSNQDPQPTAWKYADEDEGYDSYYDDVCAELPDYDEDDKYEGDLSPEKVIEFETDAGYAQELPPEEVARIIISQLVKIK